MKREYQRPRQYAERFELTEHISSTCIPMGHANHQNAKTCSYDSVEDGAIFVDGVSGCGYNPTPYESLQELEGFTYVCEYTFDAGAVVFSS